MRTDQRRSRIFCLIQNGIQLTKTLEEGEEAGVISNKKPRKAALAKAKLYGCFVKVSCLFLISTLAVNDYRRFLGCFLRKRKLQRHYLVGRGHCWLCCFQGIGGMFFLFYIYVAVKCYCFERVMTVCVCFRASVSHAAVWYGAARSEAFLLRQQ